MYSFIELNHNYKVEEISSEEMLSIISLTGNNDAINSMHDWDDTSVVSAKKDALPERLSKIAQTPLADWLLKKV